MRSLVIVELGTKLLDNGHVEEGGWNPQWH